LFRRFENGALLEYPTDSIDSAKDAKTAFSGHCDCRLATSMRAIGQARDASQALGQGVGAQALATGMLIAATDRR